MTGNGWEALLEVREGSEGPPKSLGGVGRLFRMSGKGWEALLEVQER